jgi:hypothetical protein
MMRALIKLLKYSLFTMNVDKGVAMTSGNIIGSNVVGNFICIEQIKFPHIN